MGFQNTEKPVHHDIARSGKKFAGQDLGHCFLKKQSKVNILTK